LQRGVTGREVWPPERIDEVDDSESEDNARTKNHENSCGQDTLSPFCGPTFLNIEQAAVQSDLTLQTAA